ncbi:MAG: AAA family ATPase, partial [Kiritimatiellae bacterium]|nr:AAA family ATPase [Kiritimatiellia bacterium]
MSEPKNNLMIPYGISDFKRIRGEGYYYVDKTEYLAKLESRDSFVFFVRPRRFGKSLFISMMQCYYDRLEKADFEKYFAGLWIGAHPTANHNKYLVLMLDFSKIDGTGGNSLEEKFANYMDAALDNFVNRYAGEFPAGTFDRLNRETKYQTITDAAKNAKLPLYLIIDEYDNFTNSLIRSSGNEPYRSITHRTGFYRAWFKIFKGSFDRIFMTGVSPVTMDDLTSGFNIAANISQDEDFNSMLGFSEQETLQMYRDFKATGKFTEGDPVKIVAGIKPWYDGYCFAKESVGRESVFNSDMVLYHLKHLVAKGRPPENMV